MVSEECVVAWVNSFPTVTVAVGELLDLKIRERVRWCCRC
jgi:hypothetical protein